MTDTAPNPPNQTASLDLSGRRLGDYQIVRRLGKGAMAEVYLAEQCSLRRQVALKVLRADLVADQTYVKRFHNEAMAAAALTHANIVQIHEVGQLDGVHFIAQEYVRGQNLGELIRRQGTIDVRLTAAILRQVAAALHKAAQHGIVHRDIKPENIMLSATGEVKVADFGLARIQGADGMNLTQVGVTMGTPLYMAPEQIEGKSIDTRADLYALGVTCYHMLSGSPPFEGENALAVAVQHINTAPPRLEGLRGDLPDGLCRIVHTLISKKPEERYPSARDLLRDLRGLRIEGLQEDWSEGLDEWATSEMSAATDARMEATQQLDTLMKADSAASSPRRRWNWIAVVAAGIAVGVLVALALRPSSLLSDTETLQIPKRKDAWRQLLHAKRSNTEQAWQSVEGYFPDSEYEVLLAKQGLVNYYLWSGDPASYEKALPLVDELIALGDDQSTLRAFGLAGKSMCVRVDSSCGGSQRAAVAIDSRIDRPA